MNTTRRATPNAKYSAPPLSRNSRESPASAVVLPAGRTRRAESLGAVAVERDPQLRLVDPQIGVDVGEPLDPPRVRRERVHRLAEPREIRILHDELYRLTEAERPGRVRERPDTGDAEELGEESTHHLLDGGVSFAPIFQDNADESPVDPAGESAD